MASDPELPRFAGPSCHWQKAGQSRIDLPRKAARSSAASQHLLEEVLHFVCELRGPITTGSRNRSSRAVYDPSSPLLVSEYGSQRARGRQEDFRSTPRANRFLGHEP